jgi:murein DD-endopeptidase MepM/ murein hydrolase activator NlpD
MPKKVAAPTYINLNTSGSDAASTLISNFNALSGLFIPYDSKTAPIQDKTLASHLPTYNFKTALKDIIAYFQGITDSITKNKAIIPVKTSLTIDGIGGLIIGHLFKIPPDLLPKGYKISSTGHRLLQIVTGIGHKIENGDWTTTIDAQQIITGTPKGSLHFTDIVKVDSSTGQLDLSIATPTTTSGLVYPIHGSYTINSPALSTRNNPKTNQTEIHGGVDLGVPVGTQVFAVEAGTVIYVGYQDNGAGNYVKIAHTDSLANYTTLYMHLNSYSVKAGDTVAKGQQIGFSGNTGSSTGPHLHFEMRKTDTNEKINPNQFFPGF